MTQLVKVGTAWVNPAHVMLVKPARDTSKAWVFVSDGTVLTTELEVDDVAEILTGTKGEW